MPVPVPIRHGLEKHLVEHAKNQNLPGEGNLRYHARDRDFCASLIQANIEGESVAALLLHMESDRKIFELCRLDSKIIPLNVETEAILRGHLVMTFMSAVILRLMSDKLKRTSLTTASMFMNLYEQYAIIYDNEFITIEQTQKMNEAYKAFKVQCPVIIPYKAE